ncbi:sensor histidine kinase [Prescottella agglutinans]|uniref:histidine kinase n=1 Tax=Prescottella agglutinans TaxID=1644129 RepID=A0ABT6MGK9_9NOCA|nr:ATP-binding protein [Prescottella agglutinans]MDH6282936.1 two-component system OmpR family sensor kinase [Prescottella agglutinans]
MPLTRLPLRARLVAGFVASMLVVLTAAGAFVFWRVQDALDSRLDNDLTGQASDLQTAVQASPDPTAALDSLRGEGRNAQLLSPDGTVLAAGADQAGKPALLSREESEAATTAPLRTVQGNLFSAHRLRLQALPVTTPDGHTVVAVAAVELDQRDEALRELLAQLALANLAALAVASAVGYYLARAALVPVERYRARAQEITAGATGVRLDVPAGPDDEISRLGHTFNAMLDAQEQAALRQQQFIDDASHELRTPLTVLATEVELALRRPRTVPELETTLRRIAGDTARLVQLAEDLLALGAQGTSAPHACDVATREVLEAAARRARSQLPDGSSRSVHVVAPDHLLAHVDPVLIGRALGNLADNAVRHGGGAITLSAELLGTESGDAVVFAVHDDGPGMPPDFLPQAAQRFHRSEGARGGDGSGLGLALVDAIATAHQGQLRICANGAHHRQPATDPRWARIPCTHPADGTSVSLLLPASSTNTPTQATAARRDHRRPT